MSDPEQKAAPQFNVKKAMEFLEANPGFTAALLGLVAFMSLPKQAERPAYLKDCAPINPRTAGAWRGKGSFGHGFGSQVKHR